MVVVRGGLGARGLGLGERCGVRRARWRWMRREVRAEESLEGRAPMKEWMMMDGSLGGEWCCVASYFLVVGGSGGGRVVWR